MSNYVALWAKSVGIRRVLLSKFQFNNAAIQTSSGICLKSDFSDDSGAADLAAK
jgi:hypothetical protein